MTPPQDQTTCAIEYDIGKRWEQGLDHHPKALALAKRIADIDFKHGCDALCLRFGGDGDNGEALLYALDIIFEEDEGANDA